MKAVQWCKWYRVQWGQAVMKAHMLCGSSHQCGVLQWISNGERSKMEGGIQTKAHECGWEGWRQTRGGMWVSNGRRRSSMQQQLQQQCCPLVTIAQKPAHLHFTTQNWVPVVWFLVFGPQSFPPPCVPLNCIPHPNGVPSTQKPVLPLSVHENQAPPLYFFIVKWIQDIC